MLIAEDLLLLLTDDASGRLVVGAGSGADIALGGAVLIELALMERVKLSGTEDPGRKGRIVVLDDGPTGDALLDGGLRVLRTVQGKKPSTAVNKLGKNLRDPLYRRLVTRGILRTEQGKVMGLFPHRTWPAEDARHEGEIRHEIANALNLGTTPQPRIAALISLVQALRAVHKVIDIRGLGLTKTQATARAKQVAEGDWGSKAVRQAVEEMMAAVMVATTAAVSASTTAG